MMKMFLPIASLFAATMLAATAAGAVLPTQAYPSCDVAAQHNLTGEVGGEIKDSGQAHISMRSNILQADIGSARKSGRLTQAQAGRLWQRIEAIRGTVSTFVARQGFLSAAERATYDGQLDEIAKGICPA